MGEDALQKEREGKRDKEGEGEAKSKIFILRSENRYCVYRRRTESEYFLCISDSVERVFKLILQTCARYEMTE